jgi:peptidoglycan/xylan/chitin deacetylase (PgdA/CDA1 family)
MLRGVNPDVPRRGERSAAAPPARLALRWIRRGNSAILAYHGLAAGVLEARERTIPRAHFRVQVEALRDAGFEFVTVSQLARQIRLNAPPPGLVALTFDDGLLNVFEPLMGLAEKGVPTTVYPVTEWIGKRIPAAFEPSEVRLLERGHLGALADAGVEIGAHTMTHPDLSTLGYSDCMREMRGSREILEGIAHRPVTTFAYPFGRHSPIARRAARDAGFEAAVAEDREPGWDNFKIARAPVRRSDGWALFTVKASGAWPALATSVPGRLVRTTTRPIRRWSSR